MTSCPDHGLARILVFPKSYAVMCARNPSLLVAITLNFGHIHDGETCFQRAHSVSSMTALQFGNFGRLVNPFRWDGSWFAHDPWFACQRWCALVCFGVLADIIWFAGS